MGAAGWSPLDGGRLRLRVRKSVGPLGGGRMRKIGGTKGPGKKPAPSRLAPPHSRPPQRAKIAPDECHHCAT